jgi:hypothetical protein
MHPLPVDRSALKHYCNTQCILLCRERSETGHALHPHYHDQEAIITASTMPPAPTKRNGDACTEENQVIPHGKHKRQKPRSYLPHPINRAIRREPQKSAPQFPHLTP